MVAVCLLSFVCCILFVVVYRVLKLFVVYCCCLQVFKIVCCLLLLFTVLVCCIWLQTSSVSAQGHVSGELYPGRSELPQGAKYKGWQCWRTLWAGCSPLREGTHHAARGVCVSV